MNNFIYEDFIEIYPHFKDIALPRLEQAYTIASLIHTQTASKEYIDDKCIAKSLIYLLVAHILGLEERGDSIVGRLSNASEGSISTAFHFSQQEKSAWFNQSQSGASYYQLVHKRNFPRYYAGG